LLIALLGAGNYKKLFYKFMPDIDRQVEDKMHLFLAGFGQLSSGVAEIGHFPRVLCPSWNVFTECISYILKRKLIFRRLVCIR